MLHECSHLVVVYVCSVDNQRIVVHALVGGRHAQIGHNFISVSGQSRASIAQRQTNAKIRRQYRLLFLLP